MSLALLLALAAVAMIALATPRQAGLLLGPHDDRRTRVRLRLTGWTMLLLSVACLLANGDRGRHALVWIGAAGLFGTFIAVAIGTLTARPGRR
jgi:hypothetical protein